MCKNCVITCFPQRETLCADSGVYLQNFVGCSQCNERNRAPDSLISKAKNTIEEIDEDDDINKEVTTFERKLFVKKWVTIYFTSSFKACTRSISHFIESMAWLRLEGQPSP